MPLPEIDEDLIGMRVGGIVVDPRTNVPVVVLRSLKEPRLYLPIFIGGLEAAAIVTVVAEVSLPRPMTHDLLATVLDELHCGVERVTVTRLHEGTFYAEITLVDEAGVERNIDARPSDGIALALRVDAPVFVAKGVIVEAGAMSPSEDELEADAAEGAVAEDLGGAEGAEQTAAAEGSEAVSALVADAQSIHLEDLGPEDFGKYKM